MNRAALGLLLSLAAAAPAIAACDPTAEPCSLATNGSFDITGVAALPMGLAGAQSYPITFRPPAGYRVRILRVYGDFNVVPVGVFPSNAGSGFAGALFGLSTTGPEGSVYAELAADNCMLYVQAFTHGEAARAAFDDAMSVLLESDNKLVLKAAVFMNTLGLDVHMEPSFIVVYRFEPSAL